MKLFRHACICMLLAVLTAHAGTTGILTGSVSASDGASLPGATVLLQSPNMIGTRSLVTDEDGSYRAVFLPPGTYKVTVTFTGFRTAVKSVKVDIDGNTVADFTLEIHDPSIEDTITVTADASLIDVFSTESGGNFNEEVFNKLPIGRQIDSVMDIAPGVMTKDVSGDYSVGGSTGPENQYVLDGVNTSSIQYNTNSANLNFDFIQEVQVKTGGYDAEFGRATGGILNVITKSGGNEFEGSVYGYSTDRSNTASPHQLGVNGNTSLGQDYNDFGVYLGGPIIKDRLWFFAGVNPTQSKAYNATPADVGGHLGGRSWADVRGESETITAERDITRWSGKLTWQVNETNTVTLSGNGDPQEAVFRDSSGTASTDQATDFDSTNYQLKWSSILSQVFTLDASYASHEESRVMRALDGGEASIIAVNRVSPTPHVGGVGSINNYWGDRDTLSLKVGAFVGNHNLKGGVEFEETQFRNDRRYTGLGWTQIDFENGYFWNLNMGQQQEDGTIVPGTQSATTNNEYLAYFIQDSWSVTPRLVLNLGLRNEVQTLLDSTGKTYHEFDDNLAPRIGATWDFRGDGRSKLFAHYGQYYQNLPMDINNRAAAPEILYYRYYYLDEQSPDSALDWNDAEIARHMAQGIALERSYGSGFTNIDPNTKATNTSELILGIEYELKEDWVVGFKYVNRALGDAVEDISFDGGNNYIIGNPGRDVSFTNRGDETLEFYDFLGDLVSVAPGEAYTLSAEQIGFPKLTRDYNGYEFLLRKAYRDNYQFQLSYVHSSTRGNYVGSVAPDGQVDPGITSLFDLTSTTVNASGLLPQHRRHILKFDGSYEWDWGLLVGARYRYTSGAAYDAIGNPDVGNNFYGDFYLIERGSAGVLPAQTDVDLRLEYNMKFTGKMNLSLYADIFNVFDFQEATAVSRQFSYDAPDVTDAEAEWNTGLGAPATGDDDRDLAIFANRYYSWAQGRFSSVNELVDWYEANGLTWEADTFGKPISFQRGRSTRLGARFRF